MEKPNQTYELWIQAYPRDEVPPTYLIWASNEMTLGQFEKAATETREALRLNRTASSHTYIWARFTWL